MFRKLKKTYNFQYKLGKKQIDYGNVISYHDVELTEGGVLNLLPLRYRDDFCVSFMDISGEVTPHTDSEIKCTINFYIEPGNYMTKFFDVKEGATISQIENQTTGHLFDKKDLRHNGTFIANAGDGWLLDVTQVHSVEPYKEVTRRTAICLATDKYDYQQVAQMLFETGNI